MESKKVLFPNLRAEMTRYGNTQKELGNVIGITSVALCNKLNGKVEFTKTEIDKILNYYKKKYEELFK